MALPGTEPLVRCESLSIGYADADGGLVPVVSDVSFTIAPGEAVGIVGESGSGKSTLARALLGYRRAGSAFLGGRLFYRDTDMAAATVTPAVVALRGTAVAMVPQNPLASLTFHMPVGRQVVEVLRTRAGLGRSAAGDRMLELLRRTGLPEPAELARRYPHQLSGGQRQRVVIAAALACNPDLLVLDEPTTALDKTTEAQVLELVADLRRDSGAALVLVTHDLNVVARVCERVLVMKDGRIVEDGPVGRVFSRPRTAYARQLLGAALLIDPQRAPQARPRTAELLSLRDVAFSHARAGWFGRTPAVRRTLDQISVDVGRGEVLGVIGESGSGKTTLGLLLASMLAPQAGAICFEGHPLAPHVADRTRDQRRRIQMVFQDPLSSLNPRQTVGSALIRPLRHFFGLDRTAAHERTAALFARLGMGPEYLDRFPRQLSGGQQQRVAIARAFAAEPDLLICDEITSALDASVQAQVLDHLLELQRGSAAAMLVITHDLSVIWKVAPRVIVLKDGHIVEQGATEAVFGHPKDRYTADLLESATLAARLVATA